MLGGLNMQRLGRMDYATAQARFVASGAGAGVGKLDEAVWEAVKANCETLSQAVAWQGMLTMPYPTKAIGDTQLREAAIKHLPSGVLTGDSWQAWTGGIIADTGLAKKEVYQALRLALTGRDTGPEMARLVPIVGRERILQRISKG
ncbi:MAG: hypothetical protein MJE68_11215 [Proteobacteria bacterium]|nr:hypothetical protein [Pseudomonadota bacterium]